MPCRENAMKTITLNNLGAATMHVRVRLSNMLKMKIWLGLFVIRLGAYILGFRADIKQDEP